MVPDAVAQLVVFLRACYPTWRPEENTVSAWSLMLAHADHDAVNRAAQRHAATSKWPPSLAEILTAVAEESNPTPLPEDVLAEVRDAVARTPWDQAPKGLSSVAQQVVESLGWSNIVNSENADVLRAHILKSAERLGERARFQAQASLAGLPAPRAVPALSAPKTCQRRGCGAPAAHAPSIEYAQWHCDPCRALVRSLESTTC